jgi:hypothetical protein
MDFDAGTVQRNSFNTDTDDLLMLELLNTWLKTPLFAQRFMRV